MNFLGKGKDEEKEKEDKPTDYFEVESQKPKEPQEKKIWLHHSSQIENKNKIVYHHQEVIMTIL